MTNTSDLLQQIRTIVQEETEPLKKGQVQTNERLSKLDTGQVQTNASLAQTNTVLEALKAGQDEIRDTMATQADVQDVAAKLDKYQKENKDRFDNLEEHTGTSNPHKH